MSRRLRYLQTGQVGRRTDRRPYAVLDVETDSLRGSLVYWTARCECRPDDLATGRDAVSLWDHVTSHSGRLHANRDHVWWAHNGGEYDYLYLIEPIRSAVRAATHEASPVTRDTTTIGWRLTTGRNRTDLRDSYALLPSSLKALAAAYAPDAPKLDIGLADGVTFDVEDETHRAYAARDTRTLLDVVTNFREQLADRFDGTLPSWSAAATALRAWQMTLRPGERYRPLEPFAVPLVRAGYVGGLVHVGSIEWADDVLTVDVNSMYPTVMRDGGVPAGTPWRVRQRDPHRPGFYDCTVTVPPDLPFTFLAHRSHDGLAWPTGTFRTVLASIEIDVAAERHDIAVTVHGGIVWPRLVHPFGTYVDRVEAMRREGGAASTTGKLMGNGLYGKFGSRPVRDEWLLSASRPGPEWSPPPFDATDPDQCAAFADLWQRTDVPLEAPYLLPHWAAWITAGARLRLVELADAIGHVLYTDTDSVTARRSDVEAAVAAGRVRMGPEFGAVKIETEWRRFRALGPKVAQGVTICRIEGEHEHGRTKYVGPHDHPVYKAKGIPRAQVAAAFDPGRPEIAWASPNASLRILTGAGMTTDRTRRLSELANSVAWRLDENGVVRPVNIGD